jgi:hypothetical protein
MVYLAKGCLQRMKTRAGTVRQNLKLEIFPLEVSGKYIIISLALLHIA